MTDHLDPMIEAFDFQARACDRLGSPMYARVLDGLKNDYLARGICFALLHGSSERPVHDAIPLRLLGALHCLVLEGRCKHLGEQYPSTGGSPNSSIIADVIQAIDENRDYIATQLSQQVQTNEAARAISHIAIAHWLTQLNVATFQLLEIGASAGLTMSFDSYAYNLGTSIVGDPNSALCFELGDTDIPFPVSTTPAKCVSRKGVDIASIDINNDSNVTRLLSFVWPDQTERFNRLKKAMAISKTLQHQIDNESVDTWLPRQLNADHGTPILVFHSIVWQYLGTEVQSSVRETLCAAGEHRRKDSPLVWARMEPNGPMADLRATVWNGSDNAQEFVLADIGYHGTPFLWRQ